MRHVRASLVVAAALLAAGCGGELPPFPFRAEAFQRIEFTAVPEGVDPREAEIGKLEPSVRTDDRVRLQRVIDALNVGGRSMPASSQPAAAQLRFVRKGKPALEVALIAPLPDGEYLVWIPGSGFQAVPRAALEAAVTALGAAWNPGGFRLTTDDATGTGPAPAGPAAPSTDPAP
jgi:hypothetical protein